MVGGWCGAVQGMPKWRSFVGYVASLAVPLDAFPSIKQKLFDAGRVLRRFAFVRTKKKGKKGWVFEHDLESLSCNVFYYLPVQLSSCQRINAFVEQPQQLSMYGNMYLPSLSQGFLIF